MKLTWIAVLPAAAALLLVPSISRAQSGVLASEAPGVVVLPNKLDAHKLASGGTVDTVLTKGVKLSNGTELPKGSHLIATVAADDTQTQGRNKLALRFTSAQLKGGKSLPIKATILFISTDLVAVENDPSTVEAVIDVPHNLSNQPDRVDQPGVTSGVDLHSNATSSNSGVLVTDKDDIKLPEGTKMELALAPSM